MVTKDIALKERIVTSLDLLSAEALAEVASFVAYHRHRQAEDPGDDLKPVPVALEGLWEGVDLADEDIDEIRREMWEGLGEREI